MNTSYDYNITPTTSSNFFLNLIPNAFSGSLDGLSLYLFFLLLLIGLPVYIYSSNTLSKIFKKAGIKSWIAWVPFYNTWKFFELGNFNGALSLIAIASVIPTIGDFAVLASTILAILAANNIGKGFGKKGLFTVLAVLLPFVWLGILAFGKDKWSGKMYQKVSTSSTPPAAPTPPTSTNS